MKKITVINEYYTDPQAQSSRDRIYWELARPELYYPNLWEWLQHKLGTHWSYGQSYCPYMALQLFVTSGGALLLVVAGGNTEQLRAHLARARDNGVTEAELKEMIIHDDP